MDANPNKKSRKVMIGALAGLVLIGLIGYGVYAALMPRPSGNYVDFTSDNPDLDFTFKYPSEWEPKESGGRSGEYDTLHVFGPLDEANQMRVGFVVTTKESLGGKADDLLGEYLDRTKRYSDFQIKDQEDLTIDDIKTSSVTYEHGMMLPPRSTMAKRVPVKGEVFYIVREGKWYRLRFFGTKEQFKEHFSAFRRMIKSFRFTNS